MILLHVIHAIIEYISNVQVFSPETVVKHTNIKDIYVINVMMTLYIHMTPQFLQNHMKIL